MQGNGSVGSAALRASIRSLGVTHSAYGDIMRAHMPVLRDSLVVTLVNRLPPGSGETCAAWVAAYDACSTLMVDGLTKSEAKAV